MKTAKIQIAAVFANCGRCEAELADEMSGSLMISAATAGNDPIIICDVCGAENKMPKWVVAKW
jgi:hypothetical protein